MSWINNVHLHDGTGNAIDSSLGAINVHDADVHRVVINQLFHRHTTPSTTLAVAASAGDTSITVTSATGFAVGHLLHINTTTVEQIHPTITAIAGNVITLDKPLDYSHSSGDIVDRAIGNMIEVGTLASPISYYIAPTSGEVWHIKKITLTMGHGSAGDLGTFGDIAGGLTNGVVLRRYDGTTSSYASETIWKTNGDIDLDMGTLKFPTRSGGGGTYGTSAYGKFEDAGSIVYLDGTAGDFLEFLVQDDLSSLSLFTAKAQGHKEGA